MSNGDTEGRDTLQDAMLAAEAIGKVSEDAKAFRTARQAHRAADPAGFQGILERLDLLERCEVICDWFCSKECVLVCGLLCGPPPRDLAEIPDPREFGDVIARITADEAVLKRLVDAIEQRDSKAFAALVKKLQIQRFCHLVCHWICLVRCRQVCEVICPPFEEGRDLLGELRLTGEVIRKLGEDREAFEAAAEAVRALDCERLQQVVAGIGLAEHCFLICEWFCSWRCILVCTLLSRAFPPRKVEQPDREVAAFAQAVRRLPPEAIERLVRSVEAQDPELFGAAVTEFKLQRFAVQLCHWLCFLACRRFCFCVCPPLIARIDTPTANECVSAVTVASCMTGNAPLVGIQITGTANGGGFDHYTLRYSWGANPPVNDAVVYPDCTRPPASPSSSTPVVGGTLGYLDVTLLPPGITEFTVYLDVFDAGAGHVSDSRTFQVKTTAVQITAAAKVNALDGEDPFHLGSFTRLIKATNDPNPIVPELSIGGAFSVDGSAYVVGCDRIMTQFVLARFDAPPAAPVPNFPDASGGSPIIAPVVYGDSPAHPWQSGCFPVITPNTILNGDLVAFWSVDNCVFLGMPYTVPKVKPVPFWDSTPLNGRFVILLEVRDRLLPGGPFPGDFAAKDQVVAWIDNQWPTAAITSIGGITGCGDLHLKDFVGTTCEVRGVAWDPPIVPTAPQHRPNDNFGSCGLSFQKNGGGGGGVPAATPNTRVPNVWPGPLPAGADGTLANWDIVSALDSGSSAPVPATSPLLPRGERCAYVVTLTVSDTTHVGDSGMNHTTGPILYAINVINDIP